MTESVTPLQRRRAEDDIVSKISIAYAEAEGEVKAIQLEHEKISLPPVNELRYAGCHLLRALTSENTAEKTENLKLALNHCRRALYDAIEIRTLFLINGIELFKKDYRTTVIPDVIADYSEDAKKINEVIDALKKVQSHGKDNRGDYCEQCREGYETLKPIHDKLEAMRPELNKKMRWDRLWFFLKAIGILFAIPTSIYATIRTLQFFNFL